MWFFFCHCRHQYHLYSAQTHPWDCIPAPVPRKTSLLLPHLCPDLLMAALVVDNWPSLLQGVEKDAVTAETGIAMNRPCPPHESHLTHLWRRTRFAWPKTRASVHLDRWPVLSQLRHWML